MTQNTVEEKDNSSILKKEELQATIVELKMDLEFHRLEFNDAKAKSIVEEKSEKQLL